MNEEQRDQGVEFVRQISSRLLDCLPMWTVYDRPEDFPELIVARLWRTLPEPAPTNTLFTVPAGHAHIVRDILAEAGFVKLDRQPGDDPVILETWI